ncbi:MAG: hypothetical protein ABW161_12590 [Candidatus Thiodiazotropha sp.]
MIDTLASTLNEPDTFRLKQLLKSMEPVEVAYLMESIPDNLRALLWKQVPEEAAGEILACLGEVARSSLLTQ